MADPGRTYTLLKRLLCGVLVASLLLIGTAGADDLLDQQLFAAVAAMDKARVEALISEGANVNAKNKWGDTPLHKTANVELAELLLAKGAAVDAKDAAGNTALHKTAQLPSPENEALARLLIARGADVNAKNAKGATPLQEIADADTKGRLCLLRNFTLDPDCVTSKRDFTALLQAQMSKGSTQRQTLNIYLGQFKGHSGNDAARKAIIDLALTLQPGPAIPSEAEAAAGRAAYIFKSAKSAADTLNAAKEYLAAIELAPWVANYYYNLCTVLEKTPYTEQALHACKLYLVAAPNAPDAADMRQRIAGLQYAVAKNKGQMKQRTAYIKEGGVEELYRLGSIAGTVASQDIALKVAVDWQAAPPTYQMLAACLNSAGVYTKTYDLVSIDRWINMCNPAISLHLVSKLEGDGFISLGDAGSAGIRTTVTDLFAAKMKALEHSPLFHAAAAQGERIYVAFLQGGLDERHAGWAMYECDCSGNVLRQDPRALPDDFVSLEAKRREGFGRFTAEIDAFGLQPNDDVCTRQFVSNTGFRFGDAE